MQYNLQNCTSNKWASGKRLLGLKVRGANSLFPIDFYKTVSLLETRGVAQCCQFKKKKKSDFTGFTLGKVKPHPPFIPSMVCTKALLFCIFLRQWLCVTILNRSLFKFLLFPAISAHPDDFPLGIRANTNFRKNTTKQIKIFTSESFHLEFFLAGSNLSGLGQTLSPVASVFLFPRLYQLVTCSRGLPSRLPLLNICTPKHKSGLHTLHRHQPELHSRSAKELSEITAVCLIYNI